MKLRHYLSKIRMSSQWLCIEYYRHRNTERQNRQCELCEQNATEDEYSVVMEYVCL